MHVQVHMDLYRRVVVLRRSCVHCMQMTHTCAAAVREPTARPTIPRAPHSPSLCVRAGACVATGFFSVPAYSWGAGGACVYMCMYTRTRGVPAVHVYICTCAYVHAYSWGAGCMCTCTHVLVGRWMCTHEVSIESRDRFVIG